MLKTVKIFIAASPGLTAERNEVQSYLNYLNREYFNKNFRFEVTQKDESELVKSSSSFQNQYWQTIREADVFVLLLHATADKIFEEFEIALEQFKQTGRPLIFTLYKEGTPTVNLFDKATPAEFRNFKDKVKRSGHYNFYFSSITDLRPRFESSFEKIITRIYPDWQKIIDEEIAAKTGILDLSTCQLQSIPDALLQMPWLTELNLSHNQITVIENLQGLINLQQLDLYKNEIVTIENLQANTQLVKLGLSANKITTIENISHLDKLEKFYISQNEIADTKPLKSMASLKRIILTNNRITTIQPLLPLIKKGRSALLKYSFDETEEGIFIKDNPLAEPPEEVIASGTTAILKYFSEKGTYGQQKLEILKLILVGNSRVGKTNFSEFLRTGKINEDNISTHLLDIQPWDPAFLKSKAGKPTRMNIFDFGGQDYYHDSHQMYYSHDTAYILLWDTISNFYSEKEEVVPGSAEKIVYENFPLPYWLESINYNLVGKSVSTYSSTQATPGSSTSNRFPPIFIIQNKIDIKEGKLDQQSLSNMYSNVWGYFNLSLKAAKRTKILEEVLDDYLKELNLSVRLLLSYQMKVVDYFLNNQASLEIISLADFLQKCIDIIDDPALDFTIIDAQIIAQILNNTGIALYDTAGPDDGTIYSNIKILNENIKNIMDVAKKGNEKGIFNKKQIENIDNSEKMIDLLSKNNSIIAINSNEFLTPQFLPVQPDKSIEFFLHSFKYNNVRFVYKAYFHKSLLLKLFAKYLQGVHIDTSTGIKNFPFWRNGIIVSKGEGANKEMVLVEFVKNTDAGMVLIKTMKPFNNKGLEKEIETTLDELNKGWTVEKEISVDSATFFNLNYLREQAEQKQYDFFKDKLRFGINDFKHIAEFKKLPKRLFISYSSKNANFIKRFVTHLEVLKSNGIIDPWYDRMIESGSRWDEAIRTEMRNADIIIFLLSPDFIATSYIFEVEIPLAIEQMKNEKSKFFFIELQPCGWERTILSQYQQTDNANIATKNIISIKEENNDEKWKEVINELEAKINLV